MLIKANFFLLFITLAICSQSNYDEGLAAKMINISAATYTIKDSSSEKCLECYETFKIGKITVSGQFLYLIGYDSSSQSIVVAFRGSDNFLNWITDSRIFRKSYEGCPKCSVHSGFKYAYDVIVGSGLEQDLKGELQKYPGAKIIFTGHSLGGAIANIASIRFHQTNSGYSEKIHIYTYGQPRVGDVQYANYHSSKLANNFRLIHQKDIVPHKPAQIIGYYHSGFELWYNENMDVLKSQCLFESNQCSNSLGPNDWDYSPEDHHSKYYLQLSSKKNKEEL